MKLFCVLRHFDPVRLLPDCLRATATTLTACGNNDVSSDSKGFGVNQQNNSRLKLFNVKCCGHRLGQRLRRSTAVLFNNKLVIVSTSGWGHRAVPIPSGFAIYFHTSPAKSVKYSVAIPQWKILKNISKLKNLTLKRLFKFSRLPDVCLTSTWKYIVSSPKRGFLPPRHTLRKRGLI